MRIVAKMVVLVLLGGTFVHLGRVPTATWSLALNLSTTSMASSVTVTLLSAFDAVGSAVYTIFGILCLGIAMSLARLVSTNCAQGTFLPYKRANDFLGTLALLPLLQAYRQKTTTTTRPSSSSTVSLQTLAVWGVALAVAVAAACHLGVQVVVRYYVLPLSVMYLSVLGSRLRDGRLVGSCPTNLTFLFPELSSVRAAWKHTPTTEQLLASVPIYNMREAFAEATDRVERFVSELDLPKLASLGSSKAGVCERMLASLPLRLHVLSREALWWQKRDAVLWVALAAAVAMSYYSDVPLLTLTSALPHQLPEPTVELRSLAWLPIVVIYAIGSCNCSSADSMRTLKTSFVVKARPAPRARELSPLVVDAKKAEALTSAAAVSASKAEKRAREIAAYEATNQPDTPWLTYLRANLCWPMVIYLPLVHILACMGLYKCALSVLGCAGAPQALTLAWTVALWPLSALGITGGSHRLWAHKSYQAALPLRVLLMLLNSIANQGSIFHWSRDHRVHHLKSETVGDPHNANRGFFFAHVGWLFVTKDPRVIHCGQDLNMDDLRAMPEVWFQHYLCPWWNLCACFIFPTAVAVLGWNESWWNAFLTAGCLRYAFTLNITWLVNSAAHFFGERPYDGWTHAVWPAENPVVTFFAMGEGWHNWHHAFPSDYAASELGASDQYNPTKMFIDFFANLGLVHSRKRADKAWRKRKAKLERTGGGKQVLAKLLENQERLTQAALKEARGNPDVLPANYTLHEELYRPAPFRTRFVALTPNKNSNGAE